LKKIFLARFREGFKDMRIVSDKELPDLARSLDAGQSQPGLSASADGASVRVEYK